MSVSFRGGVHPKGRKELSREVPLRRFDPEPCEMVFPLSQHIGKPAKAIVKKNDPVLVGQKLADADGFVSACVISSCSGTVKAVEKRRTIAGTMTECVVVESDGKYTPMEGLGQRQDLSGLTDRDILNRVKEAGIVGLGGAGFPTHVKLAPKAPEKIQYLIANGAECEPYITCNDQLMRSRADGIVEGLELTLRLFPNAACVIGIEDNKPEAIAAMRKAVSGKERMRVLPLRTKYPQGGERSLISRFPCSRPTWAALCSMWARPTPSAGPWPGTSRCLSMCSPSPARLCASPATSLPETAPPLPSFWTPAAASRTASPPKRHSPAVP